MAFHSVSWELSPLSALHRDFIYFSSYCCNLWRLLETFEWRFFFFKYYFHGLLVHIIKELKKSRSLKCHSFCWVFYWKLKESRVASYYYNNRFKRRPPVIRSLWRKKNVLPNFSSSTGSIRHEQNLIFFFFFFYAFSRYICIIREKTDSVLDSVSNPIPHGWNEKKKK